MKNKLFWFAAILLTVMMMFSAIFCWNADNKEWWQVLIPHLAILIIFILASSFLYIEDTRHEIKKMVYEKEAEIAAKEFERKKEWEKFMYELTEKDRQEKTNYERMINMLNALNCIPDPKDQEIENLKKELEELKKKKEKELFIEITEHINTQNDK